MSAIRVRPRPPKVPATWPKSSPRAEEELLPFEGISEATVWALPKIDLHRHLVGSISPQLLADVARRAGSPIPGCGYSAEAIDRLLVMRKPGKTTYSAFLRRRAWGLFRGVFADGRATTRLAFECVAEAKRDGVAYVEFRVSPYGLTPESSAGLLRFLASVAQGFRLARQAFPGTAARLLISLARRTLISRLSGQERERYVHLAIQAAADFKGLVVGFDISGDEDRYPNTLFPDVTKAIKQGGFRVTVHSGETGRAASVWQALDQLKADRIGHGLAVTRDAVLASRVVADAVPLEACVYSNYMIGLVSSVETHPVRMMLDQGMVVAICTDNPVILNNTTLTSEIYCLLRAGLIKPAMLVRMQRQAIDACFASPATQAFLHRRLAAFAKQHSIAEEVSDV